MHIYVDFDDCLCETGRYFSGLAAEMFGKNIPYEDIRYFNLQTSFTLTDQQYEQMMIAAHRPEALLSFAETAGASETVNSWLDKGYDVSVITGRPYSAYAPSRAWLDRHGLARAKLYCLNKYGRDSFIRNSDFSLEIEDYKKMPFDYAVEDSPAAFQFFEHLPELKVLVYDRPWNQQCAFPGEKYSRCFDWETIKSLVG
ncbi:MAG: 2-dehydropantoate 2-reductase [Clostridia bacterium]|nr:2-dehydropantoate 2-reductase [Clostridia bacterium]